MRAYLLRARESTCGKKHDTIIKELNTYGESPSEREIAWQWTGNLPQKYAEKLELIFKLAHLDIAYSVKKIVY